MLFSLLLGLDDIIGMVMEDEGEGRRGKFGHFTFGLKSIMKNLLLVQTQVCEVLQYGLVMSCFVFI